MSGSSACDQVRSAVAVQVGSDGIFASHAAVVDSVTVKCQGVRAGFGVEYKQPGSADPPFRVCSGRADR